MKNVLTKVSYMAFGSLLTLIGYHFGNIDNNSANAQENTRRMVPVEIVNDLWCRSLVVVGGEDDTPRIRLETDTADRGVIEIYNEDAAGGTTVQLSTDSNGGYIALFNKVSNIAVSRVGVTDKGEGFVTTLDKAGRPIVVKITERTDH